LKAQFQVKSASSIDLIQQRSTQKQKHQTRKVFMAKANNSNISVVLVHGAFADGSSWSKVIPLLRANGLNAVAVQNPLTSLADDVAATKRVLDNQGGPVVLAGHSWGGVVITEAGNDPRVVGLVYVAAGAPDSGQSFNDWWKDYPPQPGAAEIKPYGKDGFVALTPKGVETCFVQDLTPEEASLVYATQGPLAVRCFDDKIRSAAWRRVSSWYIVAENDRIIPPAVQRDSAARMKADTHTLASGHVPMLSRPREVASVIEGAVTKLAANSAKS
jgi:pimeloyl-ACP methyl ester carboxylesterase